MDGVKDDMYSMCNLGSEYTIAQINGIWGQQDASSRVMAEMRSAGFEIKKTYRVFEHPYHRFFVLVKGHNG